MAVHTSHFENRFSCVISEAMVVNNYPHIIVDSAKYFVVVAVGTASGTGGGTGVGVAYL